MNKIALLSLAGLVSLSAFSLQPIEEGDKVPDFTAIDENGKTWTFSEQRATYLVFYFYPAAFTGGCTTQACSYRDQHSGFSLLGAEIIGISGDSYENLNKFREQHNLNFKLLSDPNGEIAELFGVPTREGGTIEREIDGISLQLTRGVTTSRWTFVVDGNKGRLIYKDEDVNAEADPGKVLKFITTHNQRKTCAVP